MESYGLIGKPLTHSFSKRYFTEKFDKENIQAVYHLYPLDNIGQLPGLINEDKQLKGLSVTIPYKSAVIPFLDAIDDSAKEIGAVNTIKVIRDQDKPVLIGFNTDIYGFEHTLDPFLTGNSRPNALVLGTGGASKAVQYVLHAKGITFKLVSRSPSSTAHLNYSDVTANVVKNHSLLINTTPVGMFPHLNDAPEIPYKFITSDHILIDLIYNPEETLFLKNGRDSGASTANGMQMLIKQAEEAWKIWNRAYKAG
jgi:shikimate dehydrogenase